MDRESISRKPVNSFCPSIGRSTPFGLGLITRITLSLLAALMAASLIVVPSAVAATREGDHEEGHWIGTWATGPAGPAGAAKQYSNQTLRLVVHTSAGGDRVRVRISNTFGTESLALGSAHIARRSTGAGILAGTDRALTFSGRSSFTIPAGGLVISDPVRLQVPALSDLAVSLYLPGAATASTTHLVALQTSYIAKNTGDFTGDLDLPGAATTTSWDFLTGVDVSDGSQGATIVALGDSITDGVNSTLDANRRWPGVLAGRLQASKSLERFGVLNEGVIGNRILHPTEASFGNLFAPSALARFDRDVLGQAGLKYVIVLLGINDIGHPGGTAPVSEEVSAEDIIAGHLQLIARAHEKGLKIYGCTLTPFENTTLTNFFSPAKEALRQTVNAWIRTSGAYDAVIDFDEVVRDPGHPARFLPAFDGGDHLHPSDAGHKAMGEAVPLKLFRREDE